MSTKAKRETLIRDLDTGEIIAVCDLSEARARAIVRAYKLAGLFVEAVA
jgi:predicted dehydrogenase